MVVTQVPWTPQAGRRISHKYLMKKPVMMQFDPKRSGAKERSQSSDSSESSMSSGSSMDTLARYVEQLGMADEDVTDSQDYESGEDVGRENSTNPKKEPIAQPGPLGDSSRYLPSPPPVPKHVTPPSPDMLMATYKKPISSDQHADGKDDDDPSYVTIRSVNRNKASFSEDNEMPSTSYEMAPPVPQRNSGPSSPSRSAGLPCDPNYPEIRELRLDPYGIEREDQFDPLPYRKKKKSNVKHVRCHVGRKWNSSLEKI
ncbi:hypothetical protein LSAT2_020959 [Lamellibrachia satsuma]|nr:hypothetical protein LSAT2_020959 [Lamellibrachia satsuma]